jgi:hypothetical protein
MSVAGISTALSTLYQLTQGNTTSNFQQVQSEFQKLGQDLETGNLTQAQSDFATLTQSLPSGGQTGASPIAQEFSQLGQDLQSGNVSAAQQDYSKIQQDVQQNALQSHHHHHHGGGESSGSSSTNSLTELFGQLGQDLQSGSLGAAQQAYAALQQDLPQFAAAPSAGSLTNAASSSIFSQTA